MIKEENVLSRLVRVGEARHHSLGGGHRMEVLLSELVHGESVEALVAYCENFELDLGHIDLSVEASFSIYKIHLAAYLLLDQLENARFLWKRLPTEQRDAEPELCALWTVGKAMWSKDHAATQGAITGFSWSPPLVEMMMQRLQREHLARCFEQAIRAYSLVSAESLSQTMGVFTVVPHPHTAPSPTPRCPSLLHLRTPLPPLTASLRHLQAYRSRRSTRLRANTVGLPTPSPVPMC